VPAVRLAAGRVGRRQPALRPGPLEVRGVRARVGRAGDSRHDRPDTSPVHALKISGSADLFGWQSWLGALGGGCHPQRLAGRHPLLGNREEP
jgi:hypothetical protein